MHEFSVMQGVFQAILGTLKTKEYEKVVKVTLEVGTLSFLSHEALEFAFEALSDGSPLEGAALVIDDREAEVECLECGYKGPLKVKEKEEFHMFLPVFSCPECGGGVEIIEGRDCIVRSVDISVGDE